MAPATKTVPLASIPVDPAEADVDRILAEMMEAEAAPETGTMTPTQVVSRMLAIDGEGGEAVPAPTVLKVLQSAGVAVVYHTETGEPSLVNRNMLPTQLKKKRDDGLPAFSVRRPAFAPIRGTLKCMLHASDPNRAEYAAMGLPTCRKANLTTAFQVKQHMKHRHKREWETLEEIRLQTERDEESAFRRAFVASVQAKAAG